MAAAANSDDSGRATVREVYHLVGEVRDDLGGRIDGLASRIDQVVVAHEHRLTQNETRIDEHSGRLDDHDGRIKTLEESHANARGHVSAFKWIAGAAGGLVAAGMAGLIADLIYGVVK